VIIIRREIGSRIKARREGLGMSRRELALNVGTTVTCIGFWERGEHSPNADSLCRACLHLRVSADYILGLDKGNT